MKIRTLISISLGMTLILAGEFPQFGLIGYKSDFLSFCSPVAAFAQETETSKSSSNVSDENVNSPDESDGDSIVKNSPDAKSISKLKSFSSSEYETLALTGLMHFDEMLTELKDSPKKKTNPSLVTTVKNGRTFWNKLTELHGVIKPLKELRKEKMAALYEINAESLLILGHRSLLTSKEQAKELAATFQQSETLLKSPLEENSVDDLMKVLTQLAKARIKLDREAASLRKATDWTSWQRIPVLDHGRITRTGRIKPLDTFSEELCTLITGRSYWKDPTTTLDGGKEIKYYHDELLLLWLMDHPSQWASRKMIRCEFQPLRKMLDSREVEKEEVTASGSGRNHHTFRSSETEGYCLRDFNRNDSCQRNSCCKFSSEAVRLFPD